MNQFAGKITLYGGSNWLVITSEAGAFFPTMSGTAGTAAVLVAYDTGSGLTLQTNGGPQVGEVFLAFDPPSGLIYASGQASDAALFTITPTTGSNAALAVISPATGSAVAVQYAVASDPTLCQLTAVNGSPPPNTSQVFGQTVLTPGAAAIQGGASAAGCDFSGVVLTDVTLANANFQGANFTDAQMTGNSEFSGANFKSCNFQNATICSCDLSGADFSEAQFNGAQIYDISWGNNTNLGQANFTTATLGLAIQTGPGLSFAGATLDQSQFSEVDFGGADFTGAQVSQCVFAACNFTAAILGGLALAASTPPTSWRYCTFGSVTTSATFFGAVSLYGADFSYATFDETVEFDAVTSLEQAIFDGAYAYGVSFRVKAMNGVSMAQACLMGADFTNADLSPSVANPPSSNAIASDLSGALLQAAILTDADLTGANLTSAQIAQQTGTITLQYNSAYGVIQSPWPTNYSTTINVSLANSTICPNGFNWGSCSAMNIRQADALTGVQLSQWSQPPAPAWPLMQSLTPTGDGDAASIGFGPAELP